MTTLYCLKIRDFPNLYLYPPGTGWPCYTPRSGFLLRRLLRLPGLRWSIRLTGLSLSLILRPTVSRPVCLVIKHPSGAYCQILLLLDSCGLMWGALSDERMGQSFTTAAGPRQRSHSLVRAPWDSRLYFTVSDSRYPFSSPPTTRRATVEVFDSASTLDSQTWPPQLSSL
jgi:hypothetical protein